MWKLLMTLEEDLRLSPSSKEPIVDEAIRHNGSSISETYLLIVRNDLSVPHVDYNLMPPFVMIEIGVDIRCLPMI